MDAMRLWFFLHFFIEPLWITLLALVSVPAVVEVAVSRFTVSRLVLWWSGSFTPAFGSVEALATGRRVTIAIVAAAPRGLLGAISGQPIPTGSFTIVAVLVAAKLSKIAAFGLVVGLVLAVAGAALGAKSVASHTAVESFGAFVAKALARFHCTPTVTILFAIISTTPVITSPISVSVASFALIEPITFAVSITAK